MQLRCLYNSRLAIQRSWPVQYFVVTTLLWHRHGDPILQSNLNYERDILSEMGCMSALPITTNSPGATPDRHGCGHDYRLLTMRADKIAKRRPSGNTIYEPFACRFCYAIFIALYMCVCFIQCHLLKYSLLNPYKEDQFGVIIRND